MPQIEFIENIFGTCLIYWNRLSVMWNTDKWPILVVLRWDGTPRLVLVLAYPRIEVFCLKQEGWQFENEFADMVMFRGK